MANRRESGLLDTCTYIDLDMIDPARLPVIPEISAITLAELHQGVAMARDPATRAARIEVLHAATADFDALPFDGEAASRYSSLAALTIAAGRDPRPRRTDLMIAAIASTNGLALYTRNADDFKGMETVVAIVSV